MKKHSVIRTIPLPPAPQDPGAAEQTDTAGRIPTATGEGAASALESLRKLEQSRRPHRAPGDHPATSTQDG